MTKSKQQFMREIRETNRDIGRHVPTRFVRIKRRFELNLLGFIQFFFPRAVPLKMSPAHEEYIQNLQDTLINGGQIAVAMPRGSGKTTIAELAAIWAILYGHRGYVLIVAATGYDASKIIRAVKRHFETNDILSRVFPEICHYCRALEGQTQRACGQLAAGELTNIVWRGEMLVFPRFHADETHLERCSEAVIEARGMTGAIRGFQHTDSAGKIRRPDFVLLDDPQTRESAKSPAQTASRIELVNGDIMGCAGPGVRMAAVMACTVISDDDLSDHYLNEWRSTRSGMVKNWPDEDSGLWVDYRNLYNEFKRLPAKNLQDILNRFYSDNRAAMDAGAAVNWPENVLTGDLSALQSAYNLRCKIGDAAFFAEYQNSPLRQNTNLYTLNTSHVASHVNGIPHRMLPPESHFYVGAVDINYYALSYAIAGVRSDFSTGIVDYGWFPDSGEVYNAKTATQSEEAAIYDALAKFIRQILTVHPKLQILGIDGNRFTIPVYKFIQANQHLLPVRLIPLRGVAAKQYHEPQLGRPGVVGMPRTRCFLRVGRLGVQEALFDSYYWHYFEQKMWLLEPGSPGSMSLFGDATIDHRRFAEQLTADKLIDLYDRLGETIYEWKTIGSNEMSDVATMICVLANLAGVEPGGNVSTPAAPSPRRRRKRVDVTRY